MEQNGLSRIGLYLDDQNKLRILDPEKVKSSAELTDQCSKFIESITEFKQLVDEFSKVIQSVSKEVESSKMDAFTSKNELKSFEDAIEREKQNLREQISLRKARLEQLKTENRLLEEEEQSQAEFMSKFIAQS